MFLRIAISVFSFLLYFQNSIFAASQVSAAPLCSESLGRIRAQQIPDLRNVLVQPSNLPLGAFPFDRLTSDQFAPAFTEAFGQAQSNIQTLRNDPNPATFANTIVAIEEISPLLDQVHTIFENQLGLQKDEILDKLSTIVPPQISSLQNQILFDEKIFARVSQVYFAREQLPLDREQRRLLEKTYDRFVKNGALLDAAHKARISAIDERLSVLKEDFDKNILEATKKYQLLLTQPEEVEGIQSMALNAAKERAEKNNQQGWLFTLQASSLMSVLTYADNPQVRQKLWSAAGNMATQGENDNRPALLEIAKLRAERAKLLGFTTHADYKLQGRMVGNLQNLQSFLTKLKTAYTEKAKNEIAELRALAGHDLRPWDLAYYSEKLRQKKYQLKGEDLRVYFPYDQVLEALFFVDHKMFGRSVIPRPDLPTWAPEVQAFEIRDAQENPQALIYFDPYPRDNKRGGAWNTDLTTGGFFYGKRIPHILNAANIAPPTKKQPALLSLVELITMFHEYGHFFQSSLTTVRSRSLAGTNVTKDSVEIASKFNEQYAFFKEVLDLYARHYRTGKPIPMDLVDKIQAVKDFQAGLWGLRKVRMATLDLAWHSQDLSDLRTPEDVNRFENSVVSSFVGVQDFSNPEEDSLSSSVFYHIFSSGYDAGYYVYDYSAGQSYSVLEEFLKNGIFDPDTTAKYQRVLEQGDVVPANELYRLFKGEDADIDPADVLLRHQGLAP